MESNSFGSSLATTLADTKAIGLQASDYKVGDVKKFMINGYGGIYPYFEDMVLHPNDRLIEIEVKAVQKVKKQEFIEA